MFDAHKVFVKWKWRLKLRPDIKRICRRNRAHIARARHAWSGLYSVNVMFTPSLETSILFSRRMWNIKRLQWNIRRYHRLAKYYHAQSFSSHFDENENRGTVSDVASQALMADRPAAGLKINEYKIMTQWVAAWHFSSRRGRNEGWLQEALISRIIVNKPMAMKIINVITLASACA